MKIRFTANHKVAQGDGKGAEYEAGKAYEFKGLVAESYARKYIGRGIAVDVATEPKEEEQKQPEKQPELLKEPVSATKPQGSANQGSSNTQR